MYRSYVIQQNGNHSHSCWPRFHLFSVKFEPLYMMNILILFSCFCTLMGSSITLTCWDSDGYKNTDSNTNVSLNTNMISNGNMLCVKVIYPLECPSSANTSCFQKFYRVVSFGPYYYISGCSNQEPSLTTMEKRV